MEAFESFVALTMEDEGLVVSEAIKFFHRRPTKKTGHPESQMHGYEVDLIGARSDKLVLASVKSFFGSQGVNASDLVDHGTNSARYKLLNEKDIRDAVVAGACERYGYQPEQVEMRLYAGKFSGKSGEHERRIREWAAEEKVGSGPIVIVGPKEVATTVRKLASSKTYRDNPALVAFKVMEAAGMLKPETD